MLSAFNYIIFITGIFIYSTQSKDYKKRKIRGYQQHCYQQLWLGLSAVLRSRRTGILASQGKFSTAALRGTCSYPPALQQLNLYWAFITVSNPRSRSSPTIIVRKRLSKFFRNIGRWGLPRKKSS